jgi:hypothetical protein
MISSYNQNLYFKIQYRKIQRQYYNSFHYIFDIIKNSNSNMDMEITTEVYTFLFYWKLNKNYNIPCSIEMKSKQQDNICGISKTRSVVFYYKVLTTIFLLQNCVSKNEIIPKIPIFRQSQVTSSWKPTKIQNSNL